MKIYQNLCMIIGLIFFNIGLAYFTRQIQNFGIILQFFSYGLSLFSWLSEVYLLFFMVLKKVTNKIF